MTHLEANKYIQQIVDEFGTTIALAILASAVESTPNFLEQRDKRITRLIDDIEEEAREASAIESDKPEQISLDRIADLIREAGIEIAFVKNTGGGCATLFAGPKTLEDGYGSRYTMVAGPGSFDKGGRSFVSLSDFSYGPDKDDNASESRDIEEGTSESIAQVFLEFIRERAG